MFLLRLRPTLCGSSPIPVCRRDKPVRVDSPERLIEARIPPDKFVKRVLKKFGDVFESLVPEPILVEVAELLFYP
jgi:hypothetical protein